MSTVVRIARKGNAGLMEFEFESGMDAFVFYSAAKDSYREDDLFINMTEEEQSSIHVDEERGVIEYPSRDEWKRAVGDAIDKWIDDWKVQSNEV